MESLQLGLALGIELFLGGLDFGPRLLQQPVLLGFGPGGLLFLKLAGLLAGLGQGGLPVLGGLYLGCGCGLLGLLNLG